jgi:hypothetical protein
LKKLERRLPFIVESRDLAVDRRVFVIRYSVNSETFWDTA